MNKIILFGTLGIWLTLGVACNSITAQLPAVQTEPLSWIDAPLDGTVYPPNPCAAQTGCEVISHSTDSLRIVQVELSVNGQVVQTTPNADASQTLALTKQQWSPPGPGNYTLMVRAQNSAGVWGGYAQAIVTVGGASAQPTPVAPPPFVAPSATAATKPGAPNLSPSPAVTSQRTPTRIIPTPTRTFTPLPRNTFAPTRTSTPIPPPPGCSGTPVIASFTAAPSTINAGGSATLSWGAVTNAEAVEIDNGIGGVPAPGSRVVSPSATTIYVLTARCKGVTAIARAVVSVIQPPTSTPVLRQLPSPTPTRTPIIIR